jgi:hypothetical protein
VVDIGFSTRTCLPAAAAAITGGACVPELQTITASTSLTANAR